MVIFQPAPTLLAAGHAPDKLAALIYRPLHEKEASKAVAAQYATHLVSTTDHYGVGDALFKSFPPYLQTAFTHLTGIAPQAEKVDE